MTTIRERIQRRILRLRHDDRFDSLLTDVLSRSPEVSKLVLSGVADVEHLREYALRAIEAAYMREEDAKHEPPDERYEVHVDAVLQHPTSPMPDASVEEREAVRAVFRYVHAALRTQGARDRAWRVFAKIAPDVVESIAALRVYVQALLDRESRN